MNLKDFFDVLDDRFTLDVNAVIPSLLENNFITEEEFNDLKSEKPMVYINNLGVKHYSVANGRFVYLQKVIGDGSNVKFVVCDKDDYKKQFVIIINKFSKEFTLQDLI